MSWHTILQGFAWSCNCWTRKPSQKLIQKLWNMWSVLGIMLLWKMWESHSFLHHICCHICHNHSFIGQSVHSGDYIWTWMSSITCMYFSVKRTNKDLYNICPSISQNLTKWDMFDPISNISWVVILWDI